MSDKRNADSLLSTIDLKRLILAVALQSDPDGFGEDDVLRLADDCTKDLVMAAFWQMAMTGAVGLSWDEADGSAKFHRLSIDEQERRRAALDAVAAEADDD